MKVVEYTNNGWLQCSNERESKHSIYKLHAAVPIRYFDSHYQKVYQILKHAVQEGIIPAFKILNLGGSQQLNAITEEKHTIDDDPNARIFNNPFTIYLHEGFDSNRIADLCRQLEHELSDIPPKKREHLSIADLELTEHITFRQDSLSGEYVAIATASEAQLGALQQQANTSTDYQALCQALTKAKKIGSQHSEDKEQDTRENLVQGFYTNNFIYYKNELQSPELVKQFAAACAVLGIDSNRLKSEGATSEWKKIISHGYRQISLRFHPDRIQNPKLANTKERAAEIFKLISTANAILLNIAEDPKVIDKTKILQQDPHLPKHQYELQDYIEDPDYYIGMAKDPRMFVLVKNWEFIPEPERITASHDGDKQIFSVQVYKPKLKIYRGDDRQTVALRGCEAFYYLFISDALPSRFNERCFGDIFFSLNEDFNDSQKWLLQRVLTTPEFIAFLDDLNLIRLSIKATRKKIVNIGNDVSEVFLHFYRNYPDLLYQSSIDKIFALEDFSIEKVADILIHEPLARLQQLTPDIMTQLIERSPKLRVHLLARKESSIRFLPYKPLEEFFKETDELTKTVLKGLLYGDRSFLLFLSISKLRQLIQYVQENKNHLPFWLCDDIEFELAQRSGRKEDAISNDINLTSYNQAKSYIKQYFLKNAYLAAPSLNKETLDWLASDSEIDWTYYLPIAKSLIQQDENIAAQIYLKRVALKLGIPTDKYSAQELLVLINTNLTEDEIQKKHRQILDERVKELSEAYRKALSEEFKEEASLGEKLELFAGKEQRIKIIKEVVKEIDDKLIVLLKRIDNGEDPEPLIQEGFKLKDYLQKIIKSNAGYISWNKENSSQKIIVTRKIEKKLANKQLTILTKIKDRENPELLMREGVELKKFALKIDDLTGCYLFVKDGIEMRLKEQTDEVRDFLVQVYTLMCLVIGLSTPEEKPHSPEFMLGINLEDGIFINLRKLFNIYKCFGEEEHFYGVLRFITKNDDIIKKITQQGMDVEFNEEIIQAHLLKYLDNELAVYIDGQRVAVDYERRRFSNFHHIKPLEVLYSAYVRLGQEKHFEGLLPNAYEKLIEHERHIRGNGVKKYLEIRKHSKIKNPALENLAIIYLLNNIVDKLYHFLTPGLFTFDVNRAIEFRNQLSAAAVGRFDVGNNHDVTANILNILAGFLEHYSNKPLFNDLLSELRSNPILAEYLKLLDIEQNKVTSKETVIALITAIKDKILGDSNKRLLVSSGQPKLIPDRSSDEDEVKKPNGINEVEKYIQELQERQTERQWPLGGYSKSQKLAAASAFLGFLKGTTIRAELEKENIKGPLQQGGLGDIYKRYSK